MPLKPCRACQHPSSEEATVCASCGAPRPTRAEWDGWGYEYKSPMNFLGPPLVHISFKYRPNRTPVPAVGVIAIGQFGLGVINISQIGAGVFSIAQITVAGWALAQIALAWDLVAQLGFYVHAGRGQVVFSIAELLGRIG